MQDSDDYLYDDDFVVDASVIAVLDEEERKFDESQRLSQRRRSLSLPPSPPLPKRQKLEDNEALPRPGGDDLLRRLETLPEISVQGDGSYGISAKRVSGDQSNLTSHTTVPTNSSWRVPLNAAFVSQDSGLHNGVATSGNRQSRPITAQRSGQAGAWSNQPPRPPTRHTSQNLGPQDVGEICVSQGVQEKLLSEVERLRVQLQELAQAQEQTQKSLKEARDARMAKEGEVSILRKASEKTAQEHAAEVARIKAAKEAAEAIQLQMQKTMKEEMDRMKTQFTFKQHEWETSVRRTPGTIRPRKASNQPPPTPVPLPSQIRQWSDSGGPSNVMKTPTRSRYVTRGEVTDNLRHRKQTVSERPKKPLGLPGFVNAFDSTPPRSSQITKGKGKEREGTYARVPSETSIFADNPVHRSPSPPSSPIIAPAPLADLSDVEMSDPAGFPSDEPDTHGLGKDTDITMNEDIPDEASAEDLDIVPPPDWTAELHHIIFMHRLPSSKMLTMQALMDAPLPSSSSPEQLQSWNRACKTLLESVGTIASKVCDMQGTYRLMAASLAQMAGMLKETIPLLIALLDMLRVLTTRIPVFSVSLVSCPLSIDDGDKDAPLIITILCDIIQTHLTPKKEAMSEETVLLAQDTLGLLETLSWNITDPLVSRVAMFVRVPGVLSTLLSPLQPTWLLYRATRILATLASHFHLFRILLSFPDPESPQESEARDLKKIPHIEQLALHLIDTTREDSEAHIFKETILAFIASLSIADAEALTILVGSETLLPAIVIYLCEVTSLIWEENEQVMESPALIESTVMKIIRTVSLLYQFVFENKDPKFRLRQKLLPTMRQYYGTLHMFIVTMGRLSWADIPYVIDGALRRELERSTEMTKYMIEQVVGGPEELDRVWSAFQTEDVAVKAEDEDEKEAQMLHSAGIDTG
ncbi:hypothetical protein B0H21DRAFT_762053 [Amylocystis lapponica]|nr:hypothetical protein B0H21DRAFT_762053 [Amylocystis lapponica]